MNRAISVLYFAVLGPGLLCSGCRKQDSAGPPPPPAASQPDRSLGVIEQEVAEVPWDKRDLSRVYGMAPWRVVRVGEKMRMVMDGYTGKLYDAVSENSVRATPDLNHIAYLVRNEGRAFVVVDHREEPAFERIAYDTIHLSDDGSRVAYALNTHSGGYVEWIADGHRLAESHFLRELAFSPNGKHLAYHVTTGDGKTRLYLDGQVKVLYDMASIQHLMFGPDSERLAYVLFKQGRQCCAAIDGNEGPIFERIKWNYPGWNQVFFFSGDGNRVAYVGQRDGEDFLVADQTVNEPLMDAQILGIKFSPNGEHVACMAGLPDSKWFLIVDGQRTTPRGHIGFDSITFSPDSRQLAYTTTYDGGGKIIMVDVPGKHQTPSD
ncbi:MAG: hypothetical protein BIFFINMI_02983 [Phycisphaerae bacterium]|nr:hypothetical protein [Phycisphaerae bacterium]